ncbi:MAG: RDD family protein [Flavobacteriaceae bacterium]|nr:RDD family protein [Flavobacteriaceae bacterium]
MANIAINTSQNVNLDYRVANIGDRILSFLIDLFLFILYFFVLGYVFEAFEKALGDDRWTAIGFQSLLILPVMFYSLYMHILFNGQTIGKMILKIKVVKEDGSPVHWSNYMTRWMLRLVDIWLFSGSVGILAMIFSDKNQRLGDAASGTIVISVKNKLKITHTILEEVEENYEPVFMNVTVLNDKDVRLIKETLHIALRSNDFKTLTLLRQKVEGVIGTSSDKYDRDYLQTVLKDYTYFTQQ